VRIGTPAATTRGMREGDLARLAGWIVAAIERRGDEQAIARLRADVEAFCAGFPVPGLP
jgi:glycine hydroxymethyltransferase